MHVERLVRRSLVCLATLLAAACASSSNPTEEGARSEADVVTARCPASMTLELTKPTVFKTAPKKQPDGTALSADEQAQTKTMMDQARALDATTLKLGGLIRSNGTCTYGAGEHLQAVLRTKDGKARLDITQGPFRVFVFPDAFDKNGVDLGPHATVNLFANIAASGGKVASRDIRIGKIRVSSPEASPPTVGSATLRVPVLDEDGELISESDGSFPQTIVLDVETGPRKYSALADRAEKNELAPMRRASPNDLVTGDPATTLCFEGDEHHVCDLLTAFTDTLFPDTFGIAATDKDGSGCVVGKDSVTATFLTDEPDFPDSTTVPRCGK